MSDIIDSYNQRVSDLQETFDGTQGISVDIPEYVYQMIVERAKETGTHETNALISLIRTGDFVHTALSGDGKLVLEEDGDEDSHSVRTQLTFE